MTLDSYFCSMTRRQQLHTPTCQVIRKSIAMHSTRGANDDIPSDRLSLVPRNIAIYEKHKMPKSLTSNVSDFNSIHRISRYSPDDQKMGPQEPDKLANSSGPEAAAGTTHVSGVCHLAIYGGGQLRASEFSMGMDCGCAD